MVKIEIGIWFLIQLNISCFWDSWKCKKASFVTRDAFTNTHWKDKVTAFQSRPAKKLQEEEPVLCYLYCLITGLRFANKTSEILKRCLLHEGFWTTSGHSLSNNNRYYNVIFQPSGCNKLKLIIYLRVSQELLVIWAEFQRI